jgi:ubiquinone/menaquinone biosynthesis C-methylase UbiE
MRFRVAGKQLGSTANNLMNKRLVQEQFGASAAAYATSEIHAKGASLRRLVELVQPKEEWRTLDIATGAGHTAINFAPKVEKIMAIDVTYPMLTAAAELSLNRNIDNLLFSMADALNLPFCDGCFDLVTCRIAAHHFSDVNKFLIESARVLKEAGILAVVDNIVPGGRGPNKSARQLRDAGRFINAFEKLHDPSHIRCLSLEEWQESFYLSGFRITHQELLRKVINLRPWAERMNVGPNDLTRLEVMLRQAPAEAAEFLAPKLDKLIISFELTEVIMVGVLDHSAAH